MAGFLRHAVAIRPSPILMWCVLAWVLAGVLTAVLLVVNAGGISRTAQFGSKTDKVRLLIKPSPARLSLQRFRGDIRLSASPGRGWSYRFLESATVVGVVRQPDASGRVVHSTVYLSIELLHLAAIALASATLPCLSRTFRSEVRRVISALSGKPVEPTSARGFTPIRRETPAS